jgi:hypothetical protein
MRDLLQNSSGEVIYFYMVDSTDHVSEKTGLTVAVTLSKNGAAFGAAAGAVAEVGNGVYRLSPTTADSNTLGPMIARATSAGADPNVVEVNIIANDPYTALNNATQGNTVVPPSVSQFNARTILAAAYTIVPDLGVVQTGDSFVRIGAGGASLGDLGGMATAMKAEVKAEVTAALVAISLDKLLAVSTGIDADFDLSSVIVDKSVFAHIMSKTAAVATAYNASDDSLDAQGVNLFNLLANLAEVPSEANSKTLNNTALTAIQAEVWAKTMTELASIPGISGTMIEALTLLYMALRNEQIMNKNVGIQSIAKGDGTVIGSAVVTDTGAGGVTTKETYT